MHKILLGLLLLPLFSRAQNNMVDGPYIFYRNNNAVIKRVTLSGNNYVAVTDSFPINEVNKQEIKVEIDGHPEWGFTTRLQPHIATPHAETAATPGKTFFISDIEGEFAATRSLLLAAGVMDTAYRWSFGNGRLVVAGDLFDRGSQVCQELWLLYKLEAEASAAGGEVHVLLGNHDVMNLYGDVRYVQPAYFADGGLMQEAYGSLYGAGTELGRWLRSKNVIEKIGDILVMHGGISPELLPKQLSIEQINAECRAYYGVPVKEMPDTIQPLFTADAVFWYRGYFVEPLASEAFVDSVLAFYGVKQMVAGHDIIEHVAPLYHGKVIGVDVDEHEGTHEGLLFEGSRYYRIDGDGTRVPLNI